MEPVSLQMTLFDNIFDKTPEPEKSIEKPKLKISDSAYWLAYCGMQKAIRHCKVEEAKKLAFVVWLKNPFMLYKRLHVILFEDIGIGNPNLIRFMSTFHERGGTYKSAVHMMDLVERMANSPKNRDADEMMVLGFSSILPQYKDDVRYVKTAKEIREKKFLYYRDREEDYKDYVDIVDFAERVYNKFSKEEQVFYVPYLLREFEGWDRDLLMKDNATNNVMGVPYHGIIPYATLDKHGVHGKMTMNMAFKKLKENSDFAERFNLNMERFEDTVFLFEGSQCNSEIRIGYIRNLGWQNWFYSEKMDKNGETFETFCETFPKAFFSRMNLLRKWVFENKLQNSVNEINDIVSEYYEETLTKI